MLRIRGIFEIAIPVKDLSKAEAFYRNVLGLEVGLRDEARRWLFLWAGKTAGMIVLQEKTDNWQSQHFAFAMSDAELDEAAAELQDHGVFVDGPYLHDWMPARSFYFSDVDGHQLELCSPVE
jgi:catechol 2,3-dioxygenase-like lactoylglutathione lyase family enzyme